MKERNGYSKNCLIKEINGLTIYLYKSWDLVHGVGYFVQSIDKNNRIGFGFHKKNKITAVRQSFNI